MYPKGAGQSANRPHPSLLLPSGSAQSHPVVLETVLRDYWIKSHIILHASTEPQLLRSLTETPGYRLLRSSRGLCGCGISPQAHVFIPDEIYSLPFVQSMCLRVCVCISAGTPSQQNSQVSPPFQVGRRNCGLQILSSLFRSLILLQDCSEYERVCLLRSARVLFVQEVHCEASYVGCRHCCSENDSCIGPSFPIPFYPPGPHS